MPVEKIKPYKEDSGKSEQVEQMFDNIAPSYDFMNHAMTFRMDRLWRNKAISILKNKLNGEQDGLKILDVACGTGDVTFHLRETFPSSTVHGIDLSAGMLQEARTKLNSSRYSDFRESICFEVADCLDLPFENENFDIVTVAYGVRNFENLLQGYKEMLRVLRPGGALCVIELCEPSNTLLRGGYKFYSKGLIPLAGKVISGDRKAYSYLLKSIRRCPKKQGMTALMTEAGFVAADYKTLFPGTVAVYTARRPE